MDDSQELKKINSYLSNIEKAVIENSLVRLPKILDGEPSQFLRNNLSVQYRRNNGLFFSNHAIANQITKLAEKYLTDNVRIIDPTCGMGDLLLAFAKKFPTKNNLLDTIKLWDKILVGYDIEDSFVKITKIRLILLAKLLTKDKSKTKIEIENYLAGIERRDFINEKFITSKDDIIIINPPFGSTTEINEKKWGSGSIQKAAVFLEKVIQEVHEGQNIFAILPDVLRSGTRYEKWRELINNNTIIRKIILYGRFDRYTNVDVFIVHLEKCKSQKKYSFNWNQVKKNRNTVSDLFEVKVGPVVPFRLKNKGKKRNFINVRNSEPWKKIQKFSEVKFDGTVFNDPFVVIRRTSSPKDPFRAIPSLIAKKGIYAVENHLLILIPKDKKIQSCNELIKRLKDSRTNIWLNTYIRCRHLTKSSILNLPWWKINE